MITLEHIYILSGVVIGSFAVLTAFDTRLCTMR